MTTYTEITTKIADQWVAAFKGVEDAVAKQVQGAQKLAQKIEIPTLPVADRLNELGASLTEQLPKPSEVVQANFELASRLLTAQRDFALRLLEVSTASAEKPAAAPTKAAPAAAKKA